MTITRFAPSPNGLLHAGHALSAIIAHDTARREGGKFLLRIEDIDTGRARPEFVDAIQDDLTWLGLTWDEPPLVQSHHVRDYLAAADRLIAMDLLYPCFATRTEISTAVEAEAARSGTEVARDPDGAPLYPGLWRGAKAQDVAMRLDKGEQPAMRLDLAAARALADRKLNGAPLTFREWDGESAVKSVTAEPERWGDVVIVRKDIPGSYHLAVVVDDARQMVTHVTRGQDLYAATDLHRLLQVVLDLPEPTYFHHRLICWSDGRKLSKSQGDLGLRDLRAQGATAADLRKVIGVV